MKVRDFSGLSEEKSRLYHSSTAVTLYKTVAVGPLLLRLLAESCFDLGKTDPKTLVDTYRRYFIIAARVAVRMVLRPSLCFSWICLP